MTGSLVAFALGAACGNVGALAASGPAHDACWSVLLPMSLALTLVCPCVAIEARAPAAAEAAVGARAPPRGRRCRRARRLASLASRRSSGAAFQLHVRADTARAASAHLGDGEGGG